MTIEAGKLYYEFRGDGWPLCPWCGENELWIPRVAMNDDNQHPPLVMDGMKMPIMMEYIKRGLTCYRCGWASEHARYTIVDKDLVAVQIDKGTSLTVTSLAYFMRSMPKALRQAKALRWESSEVDQAGQRWGIIRLLKQGSQWGTGLVE